MERGAPGQRGARSAGQLQVRRAGPAPNTPVLQTTTKTMKSSLKVKHTVWGTEDIDAFIKRNIRIVKDNKKNALLIIY